jgi:hypothetical protein
MTTLVLEPPTQEQQAEYRVAAAKKAVDCHAEKALAWRRENILGYDTANSRLIVRAGLDLPQVMTRLATLDRESTRLAAELNAALKVWSSYR